MLEIGEKLRNSRVSQNLSLRELAARADVSAGHLSQIENGRTNPSVRTLYKIAAALNISVGLLFPGTEGKVEEIGEVGAARGQTSDMTSSEHRAAQVQATTDGKELNLGHHKIKGRILHAEARPMIELLGGVSWARLTPSLEENIEFLKLLYDIGGSSGSTMTSHSGREFGLIIEGVLTLELSFETYVLHPGDSIIFDSTTPHRLVNFGEVAMSAIWVHFSCQPG